MSYKTVIQQNKSKYNNWWPEYAFHMVGIEAAVSILSSGMLYSRNKAKESGILTADNASKGVIDNTDPRVMNYVRFYFRPKTPTYYHFEGYHQEGIRYQNDNRVNIPVPVLFEFDLEKLLMDERTLFNGIKASGKNFDPKKGLDEFRRLDFSRIYSGTVENLDYQHAEILYPEEYPIEKSLVRIICRNAQEREMLRFMLSEKNIDPGRKIRIVYCKEEHRNDYFVDRGLRICCHSTTPKGEYASPSLDFSIEGQDDYYSYIKSGNVLNYIQINDYPRLRIIADISFADCNRCIEHTIDFNLNRSAIRERIINIPDGTNKIILKLSFDDVKNLVYCKMFEFDPEVRQFKLTVRNPRAMKPFPVKKVGNGEL